MLEDESVDDSCISSIQILLTKFGRKLVGATNLLDSLIDTMGKFCNRPNPPTFDPILTPVAPVLIRFLEMEWAVRKHGADGEKAFANVAITRIIQDWCISLGK